MIKWCLKCPRNFRPPCILPSYYWHIEPHKPKADSIGTKNTETKVSASVGKSDCPKHRSRDRQFTSNSRAVKYKQTKKIKRRRDQPWLQERSLQHLLRNRMPISVRIILTLVDLLFWGCPFAHKYCVPPCCWHSARNILSIVPWDSECFTPKPWNRVTLSRSARANSLRQCYEVCHSLSC